MENHPRPCPLARGAVWGEARIGGTKSRVPEGCDSPKASPIRQALLDLRGARSATALNIEVLERLRGHATRREGSHLVRAARASLRDASEQIPAMKDGSLSGRSDDVRRLAHTLKSRSMMLGADSLAGLFREMQVVSQSSDSAEAIRFLPEIEGECERVAHAPRNPLERETLHA